MGPRDMHFFGAIAAGTVLCWAGSAIYPDVPFGAIVLAVLIGICIRHMFGVLFTEMRDG